MWVFPKKVLMFIIKIRSKTTKRNLEVNISTMRKKPIEGLVNDRD